MSVYTLAVTYRHYLTWRKVLLSALANNVGNPILFLFAFGFGMGQFVDVMGGVRYLDFVVAGMVAQAAMFAASFEGALMSFIRYRREQVWDAVLATPVTLAELLQAEVLWAACKAMVSGVSVMLVGALIGGVPSLAGAVVALPVVFLGAAMFAACGLAASAAARNVEFFSVFLTFWMTPMFVFSGVFFDIARFPEWLQVLAWGLPMTHMLAVVRPLMVGTGVSAGAVALHIGVMVAVTLIAYLFAYGRVKRKMFD